MERAYFQYGEKETAYLSSRNKKLAAVIEAVGHIRRACYDDLFEMVYRHRELPRERFERCRRRFSPYCSVASLYFWAVAGGAIPGLTDPAANARAKGAAGV